MSPATKIDIPKISKLNSFESKAKTIKVKLKIMGVAATTWNTFLEFWIDPESPYHKEIFNQDKTYVFYCASAWRSALSGKAAMEMGLAPVCHIEGGFTEWKKSDGKIERISK